MCPLIRCPKASGGRGELRISSDRGDQRIFLGLKFLILVFSGGRKI